MKRLLPAVCCLLAALLLAPPSRAQNGYASSTIPLRLTLSAPPDEGDFPLAPKDGPPAAICVADTENPAVKRAANDLADDVERVTGRKPRVVSDLAAEKGPVVLVGSLDAHNERLEKLAAGGKIDVSGMRGQWESHVIQTVADAPRPLLVIAGSDRRGTIYGIYTLSETIGVSPWYWWADVPVRKHDFLTVSTGTHKQAPPAVKYRGIFLNDEDWGLRPWAAQGLDKDTGNIGPHTYAKIFELLLRLKANHLWPAMHPGTRAFNSYPENAALADAYGIVMGSSHAEPMLRNNVDEWKEPERGAFNFVTNAQSVLNYWEERVRSNAKFESIFTMGMRGIHDSGMEGGGTAREKAARMHTIVDEQRKLLAQYVNPDPAKVPQTLCPYKEVLALYRIDPNYPQDITLVWPDDNFGYVRHFSDEAERARSGGAGVYYHLSYWGAPRDYLWLNTTSPGLMWEEMTKAYVYGAKDVWVVNVGDLKPAEYGMEMFLRLAWNPDPAKPSQCDNILEQIAERDLDKDNILSTHLSEFFWDYYQFNFQRKPEHMLSEPGKPIFSLTANHLEVGKPAYLHDEANDRLIHFDGLAKMVGDAGDDMRADARRAEYYPAYYQLVLYPIRCAALMNKKWLSLDRYHLYVKQGRASAGKLLQDARDAHAAIQRETDYYNNELSGGKWHGIISANPRKQPVFGLPEFTPPLVPKEAILGVALTNSEEALMAGRATSGALPQFSVWNETCWRDLDVFNGGAAPLHWTAKPSVDWIKVDPAQGDGDAGIKVSVDWTKAPIGEDVRGAIEFSGAGQSIHVDVSASHPAKLPEGLPKQVISPEDLWDYLGEDDGGITVPSNALFPSGPGKDAMWKQISAGKYKTSHVPLPFTFAPKDTPARIQAESPCASCNVWLRTPGDLKVTARTLPTWPIAAGKPARYAVSFDDQPPQIVELPVYKEERDARWQEDVLRNAAFTESKHHVEGQGKHTLKLWAVDPGVVVDSFQIDCLDWKSPFAALPTVP